MPEFTLKPVALSGELYTPGSPCPGVFEQPDGAAIIVTWQGPLPVAAGACVYPDPTAPGYYLSKAAGEMEDPRLRALKADMVALWEGLPVEVRAVFRPLKAAVLDAINDNCLDEVELMVAGAAVPAEYAPVKAGLLQLLAGPTA